MDSGLDQNESEFTVFIGSEFLNMLSDIDGFLDKMIKIFWDGRSDTIDLQDSENFRSSHTTDLGDTVLISQNDTNLGRRRALLGQLDDLFGQITSRNLNPAWWSFSVWKASSRDTLTLGVHSTHCLYLIINNE